MENKDIDKLFRDSFNNAEATPSPDLWQRIETQLDQEEKIVSLPKRKLAWLPYASAAAILLIIGGTLLFHKKEIATPGTLASQEKNSTTVEDSHTPTATEGIREHKQHEPVKTVGSTNNIQLAVTKKPKTTKETTTLKRLESIKNVEIQEEEVSTPQFTELAAVKPVESGTYRVVEIEDLKPLIEPEEDQSSMLAAVETENSKGNNTIITSLLNAITNNIDTEKAREIRFSADEEGSIRINLLNSFTRNRNKNRR